MALEGHFNVIQKHLCLSQPWGRWSQLAKNPNESTGDRVMGGDLKRYIIYSCIHCRMNGTFSMFSAHWERLLLPGNRQQRGSGSKEPMGTEGSHIWVWGQEPKNSSNQEGNCPNIDKGDWGVILACSLSYYSSKKNILTGRAWNCRINDGTPWWENCRRRTERKKKHFIIDAMEAVCDGENNGVTKRNGSHEASSRIHWETPQEIQILRPPEPFLEKLALSSQL